MVQTRFAVVRQAVLVGVDYTANAVFLTKSAYVEPDYMKYK